MFTETVAPEEFLKNLQSEDRTFPITALIKPSDDTSDTFLISIGFTCDDWIAIPSSRISSIEQQFLAPCKDHEHPFVTIHVKQPESNEGRLYASIAASLERRRPSGLTSSQGWGAPGLGALRDRSGTNRRLPNMPLPLVPNMPGMPNNGATVMPTFRSACQMYTATADVLQFWSGYYAAQGDMETAAACASYADQNRTLAGALGC
ncbi:hypothetical protein ACFY0A_43725 [Streptomyces sp. NPDC001698]|uniref:hypothetical protein n=1 Tax=Streptomyces sp. NPDC001698 TaxID=3364601 RepID=UPI0036B0BABA